MALEHPSPIDVTDIQFKVHDRFTVFNPGQLRSHINLLATASNYGLMFVGNPNEAELKVIVIKDLIEAKQSGKGLHARQVQLPNSPNCIAVSSDGSMLAVNYSQNGCGFVAIYSVPSFTKANIKSLHNIRLPGDENISALQLLWNPVIAGSLAVVMSNGALGMYDFKDSAYEIHTLDNKEQILCGSWSPKGKQIVLGFPNGKLAQYKPDLKLARTIACPPNIHPGPFNTISVQWLSTFQFAVVFLQNAEDATPNLYIVHAPKAGNPTYTNYFDICYSFTGPRAQQVNLLHIPQWNLLLVTSANGVEVGLLGTKETGEAPKWVQYTLLDEARIEMPLTENSDETYPIGFALDTSSTHQLTIAEKKLPVMPVIHTLSTHGHLVAFNFLNLQPNTPDICSPPPPISDTSGMSQFKPVSEMLCQKKPEITIPVASAATMPFGAVSQQSQAPPPAAELSFAPLGGTSTPAALEKPKPLFGTGSVAQPSTGPIMFGAPQTKWTPSFAPVASAPPTLFKNTAPVNTTLQQQPITFGGDTKKPQEQVQPSPNIVNPDKNKPLFTVPPTFNPPPSQQPAAPQSQQNTRKSSINDSEVDDIVNEMILFQITAFDMELKKLTNHSKGLLNNIGNMDEMKEFTKRLNNLQDIVDQANEKELESDLRCLLNSLNESCAMVTECRSKLNMYKYPDIAILKNASNFDPINRRQLAKLQSLLANNQAQIQIIQNQIDSQWSDFQDMVKRNSKTHMHTPYLEGIYQRMTKLKEMIARNRTKINYYKSKLKQHGLLYNQTQNHSSGDATIESLTDTILSMSLGPSVQENTSKLTKEKVAALRGVLANRKITIVKPQRPDQIGLKSEVILETKLKSDRKIRDGASTNMDKMEQERIRNEQQRVLTKPTATKAIAPSMTAISQPNAPTSFGFGGASPFVKPTSGAKTEDYRIKDQGPQQQPQSQQQQQPMIVKPVASTAAPMFLKNTSNTTAPVSSSGFTGFGSSSTNPNAMFSGMSITPSSMPAFQGFGTNSNLSFGAPKPLTANQPAKEPASTAVADKASKDPKPALSFDSKPTDSKPFSMPSFSSPFASVAQSKTADQGEKENKLPDTFSFGTKSDAASLTTSSTSTQPLTFGSNIATTTISTGFTGFGAVSAPAKTTTSTSAAPFTFSFSSAFNSSSSDTTTTTASKTPLYGGLAKPTPTTTSAKPEVTTAFTNDQEKPESQDSNETSGGFTFSSLNLGTLGLPATPNLSPTPSVSTPESSSGSSVTVVKTSNASISDPTDSLFGNLNICKPSTAESTFKPAFGDGNLFSSASFGTESSTETKSIFGGTPASKESTGFGGFGLSTDSSKSAFEVKTTLSASSGAETTTESSTTATSTASFASKTSQAIVFGTPSPAQGSITTGQVATVTSSSAKLPFGTSAATSIFSSAAATTTPTSGASIFGGTGLNFGAAASQGTPSIFGSLSISQPPASESSFAAISSAAAATPSPAAPVFGATSTTSSTASSLFASAAAATTPAVSASSGSIFGGIPKPDQSVFGQSETNVFGSPTSNEQTASGGSLFGGQTAGFGASSNTSSGGSIFGGSSAAPASNLFANAVANTGTNLFGSPTASSASNVFGTPTQAATASGGSIFDQSSNAGQSGGSLFGGGQSQQQGFGTPSSPFSGGANSGGSIFGGSATSPKPSAFASPTSTASAFGSGNTGGGFGLFSQTPAFGSPAQPNANTGGGFAQGGSSIAQTGFGSPNAGTAFAKPVFGGAPAFGGTTAFGSPPSFGSAPTFGSPKGFGSFAAPAATGGAFNSPTQNNNLFEALGSSDTGLTFGNLAQNNNPSQQKPAFGGSSFMSYRS